MADKNLKSVFDAECTHLKMEPKFLKSIHRYGQSFVNKNEDHVKFFGGNAIGVYPVRFKTSDRLEWYEDVLQIDDVRIRDRVIDLPTIDESWVRGTDVMNLSCVYLTHRIFNSNLSHAQKEQGMMDVLLVFHYKLLTSLMAHFFKYPADEATSLATYAALSKKYALKQYGNWHAVLVARCQDIIDKRSIHYRTIERFDDDAAIQYMITDIQGRMRGMVKKLCTMFYDVRAQDSKIMSMGGMVELDGKMVVRDMARDFTPYKRYAHEVMGDRNRFIKVELVSVIGTAMHTMPEKLLGDTLEFCTLNYGKNKDVAELVDETLLHAFHYLSSDRNAFAKSGDITTLITKLRAIYMSSRSTDPALMKMRDLSERLVKKAIKSKNPSVIAAVRTGLLLYIVLRTFSKNYYG